MWNCLKYELGDDITECEGVDIQIGDIANGFGVEWFLDGTLLAGTNTENIEAEVSGSYVMQVSANQDCAVSDTIEVTIVTRPVVELGDDRSACPGETVELTAGSSSENHQWSSELMGALTESSNILPVTETDTYYVEVSNASGCITRDTVSITFTELPDIELGSDITDVCRGEVIDLMVNSDNFDVEWLFNGSTIMNETMETLSVTEDGNYEVIVSAGDNCSVSDNINITFLELPVIGELEDLVACEGETIELNVGTDGEYNYIWSDDSGVVQDSDIASLQVSSSGNYSVEAVDGNDCRSSSTAEITFIAAPIIDLDETAEFCEGSSFMINATSNVAVVEWYVDGTLITGENETQIEVSAEGEYVGVVGPGTQCEDRDTIVVNQISAPTIEYNGPNQICSDVIPFSLEIITEANTTIQWYLDGSEISGATESQLEITAEGTYTAEVSNTNNCVSIEEIPIEIFELANNSVPVVPELCDGQTFTVSASSDGLRYEWYRDGQIINGETGLNLEVNQAGEYSFVSYNALDCPNAEDFSVIVNPIPDADLGSDMFTACLGENVNLSVNDQTGNTYVWSRNGSVLNNETSSSLIVTTGGDYLVQVSNQFGCTNESNATVSFNTAPELELPQDPEFCAGTSTELTINTDATDISWVLNGEVIAQNTSTLEVDTEGSYTVEVSSQEGCTISDIITVTVNQNPEVEVDDVILCPGEMQSISLQAGFDQYNWTGLNASGSDITVSYESVDEITVNNASIMVVDQNGCTAEDNFTITYNPELNAQVLSQNINLCEGESVQLQASGGLFYEWTDPNNSLSAADIADPVASPVESTVYTLNVTDNCPSNFASFDISVNVNPLPDIDAGPDTCTIAGADIELMASGGIQYIWNNTDLIIGSSNLTRVTINIEEDTTFTVTGIDDNGCVNTDSVRVCILDDPFQVLTAVTLITPNGDFVNDELEFNGLDAFPLNKLTIFNRWGNVIFTKSGYQTDAIRWDGTRDGQQLPADTYYYILEFADFRIKKSITLLRD